MLNIYIYIYIYISRKQSTANFPKKPNISYPLIRACHPFALLPTSNGSEFDSRSEFSLSDGIVGKNVLIFGVGMSASVHLDKIIRKKIS